MREDTVVQLRQPGAFSEDPLTEILRLGARRLLGQVNTYQSMTSFDESFFRTRISRLSRVNLSRTLSNRQDSPSSVPGNTVKYAGTLQ